MKGSMVSPIPKRMLRSKALATLIDMTAHKTKSSKPPTLGMNGAMHASAPTQPGRSAISARTHML